ncbi:unnamed protein product [Parnassius apollo]|uniref:(apollo) hypothetical protein n=1 Tax=Parnassius apollo TaxID=110799 RepID=A0A8S3XN62_PARAO|nr:unnamed protein product [Parnassius apollo]
MDAYYFCYYFTLLLYYGSKRFEVRGFSDASCLAYAAVLYLRVLTNPAPNQANTVAFWRGLWSEPVNHSEGAWTEVVASQFASITPMDFVIITPDDVAEAVRRARTGKVRDSMGCITTG